MAYEAFYYAHESNGNGVIALAGEDQLSIRSAAQRGTGPKGLLSAGWAFLKATGPRLQTSHDFECGAVSSELIVHTVHNGQGQIVKWRYILLESTDNGYINGTNGSQLRSVPPGYYCDVNVDSNGNVTSTSTPAVFDRLNPPTGSADVLVEVEDARLSEGV